MSNIPSDLKYDREHCYIHFEGNIATVGITDYAQNELGTVVLVHTPKVGEKFDQGDELASMESVGGVVMIYSPVAGTIQAVNELMNDDPEVINNDPYGEGWIVKIQVDNPSNVENLLSASEYEAYLKRE